MAPKRPRTPSTFASTFYTLRLITLSLLLAVLFMAPGVFADDDEDDEVDLLDMQPDREAGAVMYRQCALCHGKHGQGILGGKYPRIAGLPDYYLLNALKDYQTGVRGYDAMLVVGALKTAEDQDLVNLAAYVSDMELDIDVPGPEAGSARSGRRLYRYDCKTCHGRKAEGKTRKESPPLRSQYHEYLLRQIELFKSKERIHADDPEDETFKAYEDQELLDILAWIASLDDKEEDDD
ncbi:MAG: c-type cytochrome [Gammaproteobacteria bacterium]|jgi:cytochrome c553|nr:c-type cytochrome [Gammaproteobacteria bacterium]